MSDQVVELLQLQVQQLLLRVDILERKVSELERSGHHGSVDEFELVSSVARPPSPARTSSSSSTYNSLAAEIPEVSGEALRLCGNLKGGKLSLKQRAERAWAAGGGLDSFWKEESSSRVPLHLVTWQIPLTWLSGHLASPPRFELRRHQTIERCWEISLDLLDPAYLTGSHRRLSFPTPDRGRS